MNRLAAILLSLILAPALCAAQAPLLRAAADAPISAEPLQDAGTTMPLWTTPDGRVLALIAFAGNTQGAPALPQSPQIGSAADFKLIDVTHFVGSGLSLQLNNRINAYARFGHGILLKPLNSAAYSFGCDYGLAAANLCAWRPQAAASSGDFHVGTRYATGKLEVGVDYGMSWLHADRAPGNAALAPWNFFAGLGSEALPVLAVPALQLANLRDIGIGAQGRWHWDDSQSLDLGAALSRIQFDLPGAALAPIFNQAALSLGVHSGNFSGVIIGRMLGNVDPLEAGQNWTSIDLGISWRAPWRGVFSVGAQNLWSSGNPPSLSSPAHEADAAQSRVPYVQYHQDL